MISSNEILQRSLQLSRDGDVDAAIAVLRQSRAHGPAPDAVLSLLFQLLTCSGPSDEAFEVASAALEAATSPLARSTWALRRGLLHLQREAREQALADLLLVQKLRANEGQLEQARAALLRVAALPKK